MKVRFNRWYNIVLAALLSFVGYGCSDNDDPGTAMYGSPSASYKVSGTVTDENGNPIEGIKASLTYINEVEGEIVAEEDISAVLTDASGKFSLGTPVMDLGLNGVKLVVKDIDGEEHGGTFKDGINDIEFENAKLVTPGDGSWYSGTLAIEQDVKMEKE